MCVLSCAFCIWDVWCRWLFVCLGGRGMQCTYGCSCGVFVCKQECVVWGR